MDRMLQKVEILDVGNTTYLVGEHVEREGVFFNCG